MYVLRFLEKAPNDNTEPPEAVHVEHRLACSGELYNRTILTSDWRKSDATRILLQAPFELFVASQPFADYPQELCVRLTLSYVTEQTSAENCTFNQIFLPDEDVIEDLCSLLSLLSRRLIAPVAKTREQHNAGPALGSYGTDIPTPILRRSRVAVWKKRPATVITEMRRHQLIDNDPPPVGVDPGALAEILKKLAALAVAKEIVHASRLYRTALELIESRPDIAYQLLISTVEAFASLVLADYEPEHSVKIDTKRTVYKHALKYGLSQQQANHLTLLACQGMGWSKRKFIKFLADRVSPSALAQKDRVFLIPQHLCPPSEDLGKTLARIYEARSGNLHSGSSLPRSIGIGTSPLIHARSLPLNPLKPEDVPPVPWFERVVSLAAQKFLLDQTGVNSHPFSEYGTSAPD
jgi:hypothetical protein